MNEAIRKIVLALLSQIGIVNAELEIFEDIENQILRVEIKTEDSSLLIGWHGETINALQHLTKAILRNQGLMNDYFLVLDVDDYKLKQQENILSLAKRKAETVRASGVSQFLPPMSPFFRKLVHLTFTKPEFKDIATESVGEGDDRQVKIFKVES